MKGPRVLASLALALLALAAPRLEAARHVAVVLDSSGSMQRAGNDRPKYAVQATKILADLLGPGDTMTVAWMPDSKACGSGPSDSLWLVLDPSDRPGFKTELDRRIEYKVGTNFIVPVRTVAQALAATPGMERLVIVISDAGTDHCGQDTQNLLSQLGRDGIKRGFVLVGAAQSQRPPHHGYDFTSPASDSHQLLTAVGEIYQRFIGAQPANGVVSDGRAEVALSPFVREALLLVAADGPIGAIRSDPGNPGARALDPAFRGGATQGYDGVTRSYRIVRLERPETGLWRFSVDGLHAGAAWLLIQDFSVGIRFEPPATVAQGDDVPLTLELIDEETGTRIKTPAQVRGLEVQVVIEGKTYRFRDDGTEGDQAPGDGLMTAKVRFNQNGQARFPLRLLSQHINREQWHETRVIEASWGLTVATPSRAMVNEQTLVRAEIQPLGALSVLTPPTHIEARFDDGQVMLLGDDGRHGDRQAGDRIYSASWTPRTPERRLVTYRPVGGSRAPSAEASVEVVGRIELGTPIPLELGQLNGNSEQSGELDLSFVKVVGSFGLRLSSDYSRARSVLEIDLGSGFSSLEAHRLDLTMHQGEPQRYPVRIRVGDCPEGVVAGEAGRILLETIDQDGNPLSAEIPIRLEILEDSWLHCWWPVLVAVAVAILTAVIIHGYLSPARFPRNLGVQISPEEDLSEGYPYLIRAQKGSGSGFYRDAHIHITTDYRLTRSDRGALARLRADRRGVFIQGLHGNTVLWLSDEGKWEAVEPGETRGRFGVVYKNAADSLFFEFRNL